MCFKFILRIFHFASLLLFICYIAKVADASSKETQELLLSKAISFYERIVITYRDFKNQLEKMEELEQESDFYRWLPNSEVVKFDHRLRLKDAVLYINSYSRIAGKQIPMFKMQLELLKENGKNKDVDKKAAAKSTELAVQKANELMQDLAAKKVSQQIVDELHDYREKINKEKDNGQVQHHPYEIAAVEATYAVYKASFEIGIDAEDSEIIRFKWMSGFKEIGQKFEIKLKQVEAEIDKIAVKANTLIKGVDLKKINDHPKIEELKDVAKSFVLPYLWKKLVESFLVIWQKMMEIQRILTAHDFNYKAIDWRSPPGRLTVELLIIKKHTVNIVMGDEFLKNYDQVDEAADNKAWEYREMAALSKAFSADTIFAELELSMAMILSDYNYQLCTKLNCQWLYNESKAEKEQPFFSLPSADEKPERLIKLLLHERAKGNLGSTLKRSYSFEMGKNGSLDGIKKGESNEKADVSTVKRSSSLRNLNLMVLEPEKLKPFEVSIPQRRGAKFFDNGNGVESEKSSSMEQKTRQAAAENVERKGDKDHHHRRESSSSANKHNVGREHRHHSGSSRRNDPRNGDRDERRRSGSHRDRHRDGHTSRRSGDRDRHPDHSTSRQGSHHRRSHSRNRAERAGDVEERRRRPPSSLSRRYENKRHGETEERKRTHGRVRENSSDRRKDEDRARRKSGRSRRDDDDKERRKSGRSRRDDDRPKSGGSRKKADGERRRSGRSRKDGDEGKHGYERKKTGRRDEKINAEVRRKSASRRNLQEKEEAEQRYHAHKEEDRGRRRSDHRRRDGSSSREGAAPLNVRKNSSSRHRDDRPASGGRDGRKHSSTRPRDERDRREVRAGRKSGGRSQRHDNRERQHHSQHRSRRGNY